MTQDRDQWKTYVNMMKNIHTSIKQGICQQAQNTDCLYAAQTAHLDFIDIVNGMIELHWLALRCGMDSTTST
jgi:hypothetical protein